MAAFNLGVAAFRENAAFLKRKAAGALETPLPGREEGARFMGSQFFPRIATLNRSSRGDEALTFVRKE
jgi:hypothetical protein